MILGNVMRRCLCQCSKLNQKSCQSCCLESQIINIKLKTSFKKVPGPPPKLSASGWRTGSNLEHCLCAMCDQSPSTLCLGDPVACCHWPNTGMVDGRCPIMPVLTQSYPCDTWFVCSTLRELALSNLGQLLFCLSVTWSRCRNAYRDLWIMTIGRLCLGQEWEEGEPVANSPHFTVITLRY